MAGQPAAFGLLDPVDNTTLSPEQLERRRVLAQAMLKEGGNYSPVQSWTQGMARMLQGIEGGLEERYADDKDAYDDAAGVSQMTGLPIPSSIHKPPGSPLGYLFGGGGSSEETAAGVGGSDPAPMASAPAGSRTAADGGLDRHGTPVPYDEAGVPKTAKGSPSRMAVMDQLVAAGYSPIGAAGLVGNWVRESGDFHPDIIAREGGDLTKDAGYMGQWRKERLLGARRYFGEKGGPSLANNVGFALTELDGAYAGVRDGLRGAKSPTEAAAIAAGFERPRGWKQGGDPRNIDGWGDRAGAAEATYREYMSRQAQANPNVGGPPTAVAQAAPTVAPGVVAGAQPQPGALPAVPSGPSAVTTPPQAPGAPTASIGSSDAPVQGLPPGTPAPGSPLAAQPTPMTPEAAPASAGTPLSPGAATVAAVPPAPAQAPSPAALPPGAQQVAQATAPPEPEGLQPVPPMPDMNAVPPTMAEVVRQHPELQPYAAALFNKRTRAAAFSKLNAAIEQYSPATRAKIRAAVIESNKALYDTEKVKGDLAAQPGERQLTQSKIAESGANTRKTEEDIKTIPLQREGIAATTAKTQAETSHIGHTGESDNYDLMAAQELEEGRTPPSRKEWELATNRSKATTSIINTGSRTAITDMVKENWQGAKAARYGLTALTQAREAMDGGMITGPFSGERSGIRQLLGVMGLPVSQDPVVNAQTFKSVMGTQVAAMIKSSVGSQQISDGDRKFAQQAVGADTDLDEHTIRRLNEILTRYNKAVLKDHNDLVDKAFDPNSTDEEVKTFNRIFKLDEPEAPPSIGTGNKGEAPAAAPAKEAEPADMPANGAKALDEGMATRAKDAIKRGANRNDVIRRLRGAGFNTDGF